MMEKPRYLSHFPPSELLRVIFPVASTEDRISLFATAYFEYYRHNAHWATAIECLGWAAEDHPDFLTEQEHEMIESISEMDLWKTTCSGEYAQ